MTNMYIRIESTVIYQSAWVKIQFNPLHAKFVRGNKYIYSHFMSFLHIDMTQVVEIFP